MIKVGVTGGIGSGKTTFCKVWEEFGVFVVYADDLAKQLMVEEDEIIFGVKETFGEEAYSESGELNREFLAQEAFEKGRVEELNNIVHPVLNRHLAELSREQQEKGTKIFAKEAAILLQNGRPVNLDYVILLLADEKQRIKRVVGRDQTSSKKVSERISIQQDFEELTYLCDFLVVNDGTIEELKSKAKEIYDFLNQIG